MDLQIQELSKIYPNGVQALKDVSIHIQQGMFGLLGPNGAGKSTLMRTIATLQSPDQGSLHFDGLDIQQDKMAVRKILGYLPQEFGVYPRMSAEKLLDYLARLKGVVGRQDRRRLIDYCLHVTNLTDVRKKAVSGYSGGMKQRFGIAQILLNNPKLIIVDEPTAGLDPAERQRFLNILREISTKSVVIFSTHIVDDIKDLCTDMAIMNQGSILYHAEPEQGIRSLEGQIFVQNTHRSQLQELERSHLVLSSSFNRDNSIQLRVLADQHPGEDFRPVAPTLEDVYFATLQHSSLS
ncbi:MAG: ABC transporter ATP-binding protein [Bacteroidota bacterium]